MSIARLVGYHPIQQPIHVFPTLRCSRCDLNASKYRSSFRKRTKGMNRSLSKTVSTGARPRESNVMIDMENLKMGGNGR